MAFTAPFATIPFLTSESKCSLQFLCQNLSYDPTAEATCFEGRIPMFGSFCNWYAEYLLNVVKGNVSLEFKQFGLVQYELYDDVG